MFLPLLLMVAGVLALPTTKAEDEDAPYVVYANGATSERNLPLCGGPREACNVVRQRFWLPPIVYRLCKCSDRTSCPTEFTDLTDKRTIAFNVRGQLKFCSRVNEIANCGNKAMAAGISTSGTVHIYCSCSSNSFYRRLFRNSTGEYFKCVPYGSCQRGEFCGNIATDFYETYHICTCPRNHICILQDRNKVYVEEFLHKGSAYRGYCISRY